ncbi:MAG: hypothetical protein GX549_00945 [Clostridiales bacterium]|nr:hypothetical protein [Clostridiales bacterium]
MIVLLSLLDCALTLAGVARIGPGYEANPLCAWLLELSPALFVGMKMLPAAALAILARRCGRFRPAYALVNSTYVAVICLHCAVFIMME